MTKTKRRLMMGLALCMSAISVMPLAACGKDELPPEAKNRTVVKYHYGFDGDTKAVYEKAIATYNETQGVIMFGLRASRMRAKRTTTSNPSSPTRAVNANIT